MSNSSSESASIGPVPCELESATGKLIYTYLTAAGGSTPAELARALDLPRLTLHSLLSQLNERGLVAEAGGVYEPV